MQGPTIGLKVSQQFTSVDRMRQAWTIADQAGFDSLWIFDHFAPLGPDRTGDVFENWTLLAAMAEATKRVRIGTLVTGNSHRHPGILAKMAVTVDHLSGGRLDVGLGAGGDELVHAMLGVPLGPVPERLDRFEEACQVLELLWTEPRATFAGRFYQLDEALANPKPLQRPHPPLWLGAVGERRGLRIVARHADAWIPATMPGTPPEELARLSQVLDRHCDAVGRDPATIRRAVQFPLQLDGDDALRTAEGYLRAGFPTLVLMLYEHGQSTRAAAERAAALLPRLRALG